MSARVVEHSHAPLFRVVRRSWDDPLDPSYARAEGGRWNPPGRFPVLYACCGDGVARAVAQERLARAGLVLSDLQPGARPQLVEIAWKGDVVDVASPEGIAAAALPEAYPSGVGHDVTQPLGAEWHAAGREGVVCRSASLSRAGMAAWSGGHERWGELAIFVDNGSTPRLLRRRGDLDWLAAR